MSRNNPYPTFRYWLNDESGQRIPIPATVTVLEATSTTVATTSSITDVLLDGMEISPPTGDYLITFNGVVSNTNNDYQGEISIYSKGLKIDHSVRDPKGPKEKQSVSTSAVVTGIVEGDSIQVFWNVVNGIGSFHNRNLTLIRLK